MSNDPSVPVDLHQRPLGSLRVSVTDKCNIRCRYCMPEDHYNWLPHDSILRLEETACLVEVFSRVGVNKVRITGGEPLVRRNLVELITLISNNPKIDDLAVTTNGVLLAQHAESLKAAGLDRVTVSLDTLRPNRYESFTRKPCHDRVLAGIDALSAAGFGSTKLNAVVIRGFNDDEIIDLLEFARTKQIEARFIEYMDVGGATRWSMEDVVTRVQILESIRAHYGEVSAKEPVGSVEERAPASRYLLPDGYSFGIVASTTEPFCSGCNRSRLTADGMWYLCLYAFSGIDLKGPLRSGASGEEIAVIMEKHWKSRNNRGAEERLLMPDRGPFTRDCHPSGPHHEMHAMGG